MFFPNRYCWWAISITQWGNWYEFWLWVVVRMQYVNIDKDIHINFRTEWLFVAYTLFISRILLSWTFLHNLGYHLKYQEVHFQDTISILTCMHFMTLQRLIKRTEWYFRMYSHSNLHAVGISQSGKNLNMSWSE